MKIELIKTKESDGDWYKIQIDGTTEQCVNASRSDALNRALEIFDFYKENKGTIEVIKSEEV